MSAGFRASASLLPSTLTRGNECPCERTRSTIEVNRALSEALDRLRIRATQEVDGVFSEVPHFWSLRHVLNPRTVFFFF